MGSAVTEPHVILTLRNLDNADPIPDRHIVLKSPDWSVKVGRGTLSGDEQLHPAPNNAWFNSRVMSRSHAIIFADPDSKNVYIQDVGSMHGTHFAGRVLKTNVREPLFVRDVVTLGANVTRGSNYFTALSLMVDWTWSDIPGALTASGPSKATYSNTFSADYSEDGFEQDPNSDVDDDEDYDMEDYAQTDNHQAPDFDPERYFATGSPDEELDPFEYDEVELVQDSHREPSNEVIYPPRTFAVPDSDVSDAPSYISSREESVADSPTSSQIAVDEYEVKEPELANVPSVDDDAARATATAEDAAVGPEGAAHKISDDENPAGDAQPQADAHGARAPSPSDAAMVKPSSEYPMAAPPFVRNTHLDSDGAGVDSAMDYERSESAWAGHNSVLYDSVPKAVKRCGAFSAVAAPSFPPQFSDLLNSSNEHPWSEVDSYTHLTLPPLQPFSHISPTTIGKSSEPNMRSLKRKAEEGSPCPENSIGRVGVAHPTQNEDSEAVVQDAHRQPLNADVPVQSTEVEMPPRKKLKKMKHRSLERRANTRGDFVKIAAATIAGMAIGTVGTIIGLASLPPIA